MPPLRRNPVKGLRKTKAKLNQIPKTVARGAFAGQVAVGVLIKKDGQQNVPVRQGNLRNSAYVTAIPAVAAFSGDDAAEASSQTAAAIARNTALAASKTTSMRQFIAVGYGVIYALSVHENPRSGAVGALTIPSNIRRNLRAEDVHSQVGGWKYHSNAVAKFYGPTGQMNAKSKAITREFIKKELAKGG